MSDPFDAVARATQHRRRTRRLTGTAAVVGLAAAILAVPVALAAGPTVKPVANETQVFAANHACSFRVIDKTLPTSRRVERVYPNGRHVVSGPGKEKLTNARSGASIVVDSSGSVTFKKGTDGRTSYRFKGPNVLYFYPGDQGPFGTVGKNGALYHVVGKVGETLEKDDVVSAFAFTGRVTELCSKIS